MGAIKCVFVMLLAGWVVLAANLFVPSDALAGAVEPPVISACGDEEGCLQGNIDRIGHGEIVINDGLYRVDPAAAIDLDRFAVGQIVAYRTDQNRFIIRLQLLSKGKTSQVPLAEEATPARRSGKGSEPRQEGGVWRN